MKRKQVTEVSNYTTLVLDSYFQLILMLTNYKRRANIYFGFEKIFTDLSIFEMYRKYSPFRGVPRTTVTCKMECFVKLVNGLKPLTNVKKSFNLDVVLL